jgi:branched-chain amino acid transport system permease protein
MIEILTSIMIYGIIFGSTYVLISLGYTLVYGVGKILNIAHGAFYLITAYLFYLIRDELFFPFPVAIILSLIITMSIGALTHILLIKPMHENEIAILIVTFALAFFIEQFITFNWGFSMLYFPPIIPGSTQILGVSVYYRRIFLVIATIIIVVLFMIFIKKSRIGKSIRAVSQDKEAAMLSGINSERIITYTLIISGFLVGIAAILQVPGTSTAPHRGWGILTSAFAVVILGGLGSIKGTVIAAYIIGISESLVGELWEYTYAALVPLIIVLIVLIIRPRGLFGKKEVK